ncbi:hypothetical protein [Pseudomaricurvus sp.]|uniref:hypothetical protein n=1 Tax=Pseudomaricurvus sp. TaxID=2004510 RepID=UPI003F6CF40E
MCLLLMFLSPFMAGCSTSSSGLNVKSLAKSDVDLVADIHRRQTKQLLQQLNTKLYLRNPNQLRRKPGETIESRWNSVLAYSVGTRKSPELRGLSGINAMRLAFENDFAGDRVFALMVGLTSMLSEAYGHKQEFYWLDSLDQQSLYNSARNIEVMVWLLRTREDSMGRPLILTDSFSSESFNLSFERLFGKLIAHQDALSMVIAGKTQRAVNTVAHSLVSMTFIPL